MGANAGDRILEYFYDTAFERRRFTGHFADPEMEEKFAKHHYLNGRIFLFLFIGSMFFIPFIQLSNVYLEALDGSYLKSRNTVIGQVVLGEVAYVFAIIALLRCKRVLTMEKIEMIGYTISVTSWNLEICYHSDYTIMTWMIMGCIAYVTCCNLLRFSSALIFTVPQMIIVSIAIPLFSEEYILLRYVMCVLPLSVFPAFCWAYEQTSRRSFILKETLTMQKNKVERESTTVKNLLGALIPVHVLLNCKKVPESSVLDSLITNFSLSVIFQVDIVNFTKWSSETDVMLVTSVLRSLYAKFDDATSRENVEKISTVGDCYMCLSGDECTIGVRKMFRACHAFYTTLAEVNAHFKQTLNMRGGMHVGDCVGGLVSSKSLCYDYYGQIFAQLTELEATASPGLVHISNQCMLKSGIPMTILGLTEADPIVSCPGPTFMLNVSQTNLFTILQDEAEGKPTNLIPMEILQKLEMIDQNEKMRKQSTQLSTVQPKLQPIPRILWDLSFQSPSIERQYRSETLRDESLMTNAAKWMFTIMIPPIFTLFFAIILLGYGLKFNVSFVVYQLVMLTAMLCQGLAFFKLRHRIYSFWVFRAITYTQVACAFSLLFSYLFLLNKTVFLRGALDLLSGPELFRYRESFLEIFRFLYFNLCSVQFVLPVAMSGHFLRCAVFSTFTLALYAVGPINVGVCASYGGWVLGAFAEEITLRTIWSRKREIEAEKHELEKAKSVSQGLLFKFIPEQICDRIRAGEVVSDTIPESVVIFLDICNLSTIVESCPSIEVINLVYRLYSEVDRLLSKRKDKIMKIKHISSVSLFCLGLNSPVFIENKYEVESDDATECIGAADLLDKMNTSSLLSRHTTLDPTLPFDTENYRVAFLFAAEILNVVSAMNSGRKVPLECRVGLHCGPVMACVLGKYKMCYDVFSTTVNTCARLVKCKGVPKHVIHASLDIFSKLQRYHPDYYENIQYSNFEFEAKGLKEKVKSVVIGEIRVPVDPDQSSLPSQETLQDA